MDHDLGKHRGNQEMNHNRRTEASFSSGLWPKAPTSTVHVPGLHEYPWPRDIACSERTDCQVVLPSRFEAPIDSCGCHNRSRPSPACFYEWLQSSLLASP